MQEPPAGAARAADESSLRSRPIASGGGVGAASTAEMTVGPAAHAEPSTRRELLKVSLGALGVVYGDIGTSPLYAIKECFTGDHGLAVTTPNVLGILSLVTWALILVIVVKYLTFILRADNHGEGGTLAQLAILLPRKVRDREAEPDRVTALLLLLGIFGASLLCGDGVITPAISVLSAVEGMGIAASGSAAATLQAAVIPVTLIILVGLFLVQRRGTGRIGRVFGPVTLLWFVMIAALGLPSIVRHPEVLAAVNPLEAVALLRDHGMEGFLVLGAVVLVVTGGEALYADMGHFGRGPIRTAWYGVVMPGLLINYFGQGALLLRDPTMASHPFYALAPGWMLYPAVAVATCATVIASQALISGTYSLVQQAMQLGYFPRVRVVHTSGSTEGQIFIPEVNYILMVACIAMVLGFGSSSAMAAAYGMAVTGTMSITSVLFYAVARRRWKWSRLKAGALLVLFLGLDLGFLSANIDKFWNGGWVPVAIALAVFSVMTTWRRGRAELEKMVQAATMPLDAFMQDLAMNPPPRVKGTAVFMTSNQEGVPLVLLHHFKHNKVLHEQVVLPSVVTERVPVVSGADRVEVEELGNGFYRVVAHYGFMQHPSAIKTLQRCVPSGLLTRKEDTSFFLGRETLLLGGSSKMASWRKLLFSFLSRNARPATAFFGLPPNRVVELGAQIQL